MMQALLAKRSFRRRKSDSQRLESSRVGLGLETLECRRMLASVKWVDAFGGNDANDGDSELTAYASLQTAINNSASGTAGDRSLIHVKNGTYGVAFPQFDAVGTAAEILVSGLDYLTIQAVPGHEPVIKSPLAMVAPVVSLSVENSDHLIVDNIDSDQTVTQWDHWHVNNSNDLTVRNSLFTSGRDGIDFDTDIDGLLVENNIFRDININNGDEALDLVTGSTTNAVIQDNLFENNNRQITVTAQPGKTATNITIRRNIFDGTVVEEGVRLINTQNVLVENNVIRDSAQQGLYIDLGSANITVRHNTFFNNGFEAIRTKSISADIAVLNNIIYGNGTHAAIGAAGQLAGEDYNLVFNTGSATDSGSQPAVTAYGPNTIAGQNPQFFSVSDLHLQPASPALGAGTNLGVANDLEGSSRPDPGGSDPDLGAYEMGISLRDFGDAPDPLYPTLIASGGAFHVLGGPHLGAHVDAEANGQPTATANGDDTDLNGNDEDGVQFLTPVRPGWLARVRVTASGAGLLNAWIDFDDDGNWADAGEQIFVDQPITAGNQVLTFSVPGGATITSQTFARFRLDSGGGLSFSGGAADGEVEDYAIQIFPAVPPNPVVTAVALGAATSGPNVGTALAWVPDPVDSTTRVVRKLGSYPIDANDGTAVYEGTATSFVDSAAPGTYRYSFFSSNTVGGFGTPSQAGAEGTVVAADGIASALAADTQRKVKTLAFTDPDSDGTLRAFEAGGALKVDLLGSATASELDQLTATLDSPIAGLFTFETKLTFPAQVNQHWNLQLRLDGGGVPRVNLALRQGYIFAQSNNGPLQQVASLLSANTTYKITIVFDTAMGSASFYVDEGKALDLPINLGSLSRISLLNMGYANDNLQYTLDDTRVVLGTPAFHVADKVITGVALGADAPGVALGPGVALAWVPAPSLPITRIVRKLGSYPAHENDGANVYQGAANNFVDTVTAGTYYYSFFATDGLGTFAPPVDAGAEATVVTSAGVASALDPATARFIDSLAFTDSDSDGTLMARESAGELELDLAGGATNNERDKLVATLDAPISGIFTFETDFTTPDAVNQDWSLEMRLTDGASQSITMAFRFRYLFARNGTSWVVVKSLLNPNTAYTVSVVVNTGAGGLSIYFDGNLMQTFATSLTSFSQLELINVGNAVQDLTYRLDDIRVVPGNALAPPPPILASVMAAASPITSGSSNVQIASETPPGPANQPIWQRELIRQLQDLQRRQTHAAGNRDRLASLLALSRLRRIGVDEAVLQTVDQAFSDLDASIDRNRPLRFH